MILLDTKLIALTKTSKATADLWDIEEPGRYRRMSKDDAVQWLKARYGISTFEALRSLRTRSIKS
jgi:hypothetical protein